LPYDLEERVVVEELVHPSQHRLERQRQRRRQREEVDGWVPVP
jgi:hypothetical protein